MFDWGLVDGCDWGVWLDVGLVTTFVWGVCCTGCCCTGSFTGWMIILCCDWTGGLIVGGIGAVVDSVSDTLSVDSEDSIKEKKFIILTKHNNCIDKFDKS